MIEAGPVNPETGSAISWTDLSSFAQATGDVREGWELKAVRRFAIAYASALMEGRDPLCIPPVDRNSP